MTTGHTMRGFVMGAAIDPWSDGKLCHPEEHWSDTEESPLVYISKIILNWPDSTPTVDLKPREKIERLVSTILGYPKISRGMYPLDWPTHPESVKALKLSLFLDSIPCVKFPQWSLRTSISLIHRYYKFSTEDAKPKKIDDWGLRITSLLFEGIRKYRQDSSLTESNLNIAEKRVLSALHSSAGEVEKMWNVGAGKYKLIPRRLTGLSLTGIEGSNEILESISAPSHSFKFSKIQKWINDITKIDHIDDYHMNKSLRHNMLSGCSTVIESIFAKLRDSIVKKYGPSSIIIDGGGRIKFYSTSSESSVRKYIEQNIYETFMLKKDYQHPFNNIIENTVAEEAEKQKLDGKISSQFYNDLIGIDICKELFPPVSYNRENAIYHPYQSNNCVLCNPNASKVLDKLRNNTKDWINTCFPHKLIYNIGRSAKRRDTSWRYQGKHIDNFDAETMTMVDCIAVFDLNSLGFMFKNDDETMLGQITKMRKSFRFNAIWWSIISDVLNDKLLSFSSLNSWIAAGDDITLVMRHGNGDDEMVRVLEDIDLALKKAFENLDLDFSFGAGLVKKGKKEKIFDALIRAREAEKMAKLHWKHRANIHLPEVIEEIDIAGKKRKKESKEIDGAMILCPDSILKNDSFHSVIYYVCGD